MNIFEIAENGGARINGVSILPMHKPTPIESIERIGERAKTRERIATKERERVEREMTLSQQMKLASEVQEFVEEVNNFSSK